MYIINISHTFAISHTSRSSEIKFHLKSFRKFPLCIIEVVDTVILIRSLMVYYQYIGELEFLKRELQNFKKSKKMPSIRNMFLKNILIFSGFFQDYMSYMPS